ncbi:hypothetical protein [Leuconostoc pseudomesenteroides]|uniref:hypothetical protein n=1 Tax=Leuconostoc pseudomesenteroides TaxID=33968 RepID=UPI0032DF4CAC
MLFMLCLLGFFVVWLFGHVLGFGLYLIVLFIGHLLAYWYIYCPLGILVWLCLSFGVQNILLILAAVIIILALVLTITLVSSKSETTHHS